MKIVQSNGVILVTEGEYSDYSIMGLYRADNDINVYAALNRYFRIHPDQEREYCFDASCFLEYLIKEYGLKKVKFQELLLGSYGKADSITLYD